MPQFWSIFKERVRSLFKKAVFNAKNVSLPIPRKHISRASYWLSQFQPNIQKNKKLEIDIYKMLAYLILNFK